MSTEVGDEARLYSERLRLTTGDRYRLLRKTTKYAPDRPKEVTGEFANKRDRISELLTRATRDLSVTTSTPQGYRNTTQYGGNAENFKAETSGSTFRSAEVQFYIDDEAIILDVQLHFVITGYRAYVRLGVTDIYDIVQDTNPPGPVSVKLDDVDINALINGPFTITELGERRTASLTGLLKNPGWHTLRFETTSGKGRVTPYVLVRSLQLQPA